MISDVKEHLQVMLFLLSCFQNLETCNILAKDPSTEYSELILGRAAQWVSSSEGEMMLLRRLQGLSRLSHLGLSMGWQGLVSLGLGMSSEEDTALVRAQGSNAALRLDSFTAGVVFPSEDLFPTLLRDSAPTLGRLYFLLVETATDGTPLEPSEAYKSVLSTADCPLLEELGVEHCRPDDDADPYITQFILNHPYITKLTTTRLAPTTFLNFEDLQNLTFARCDHPPTIPDYILMLNALPNPGILERLELALEDTERFERWLEDLADSLRDMICLRDLKVTIPTRSSDYPSHFNEWATELKVEDYGTNCGEEATTEFEVRADRHAFEIWSNSYY